MNKFILSLLCIMGLSLFLGGSVFAQGMMGSPSSSPDKAAIQSQQQEEQEGKKFLDNLNNKTVTCSQLKDADFEKIGEYFMGQSIGDTSRHIAMNSMMKGMMGEKGEGQMHIMMGKRMSGCDTSANVNGASGGFMPMMQMMMGGGENPMMGFGGNNIMGGWGGFGILGWLSMLLFWGLLILGVIALIRYLTKSGDNKKGKTPLDILKERYARGEIDEKEFEQMKKEIA